MNNKIWEQQALALNKTKTISWRKIAIMLGIAKSTVSDYLRKAEDFEGTNNFETNNTCKSVQKRIKEQKKLYKNVKEEGVTHLYIPDNQVKPGISLEYLNWIGQYIIKKRPDVIINAGDFADMEGFSSYDVGKRSAEGKRIKEDINVAKYGMKILLKPLRILQEQQRASGQKVYTPRMVLTLGNHENRINRHVEDNPALHGLVSTDDLDYAKEGWEVVPFLTPITIDGIAYCHYFVNNMTGKPLGGNALSMLKTIGTSFTQGHRQTLDVATRFLPTNGQQQWGLVCGACYEHDEGYKGNQGNHHWRGIVVKHNVKNGSYDPLFVSLDWLKKEYS